MPVNTEAVDSPFEPEEEKRIRKLIRMEAENLPIVLTTRDQLTTGLVASLFPQVTEFPSSPYNGQIVLFEVTSGLRWAFVYNKNSAESNKWEFIGGPPLVAQDDDQGTRASTSYGDLTGSGTGPTLTLPMPGVYNITVEHLVANDTANTINIMSFDVGGTVATDGDGAYSGTTTNLVTVKAIDTAWHKVIPAWGEILTAKYRVSGSNGYFEGRRLSAIPVRV